MQVKKKELVRVLNIVTSNYNLDVFHVGIDEKRTVISLYASTFKFLVNASRNKRHAALLHVA